MLDHIYVEVLSLILYAVIWFCLPFVVIGLFVGVLQTVFSIQDVSFPFVAKVIVLVLVCNYKGNELVYSFVGLLEKMG